MLRETVARYIPSIFRTHLKSMGAETREFLSRMDHTTRHAQLHGFTGELVGPAAWTKTLFETWYSKRDANLMLPSEDIGVAESWVHFRRDKTRLLIYNFFERNYGIRDPILYRVSVFGADGSVEATEQFLMAPGEIRFLARVCDGSRLPEEGSLVVQAFHPRIKVMGNQLRYFVFYGSGLDLNCGVHSLGIPESRILKKMGPGHRNVADSRSTIAASLTNPRVPMRPKPNGHSEAGLEEVEFTTPVESQVLYLRENASGVPLGVWHDGQIPHFVKPAETARKVANGKTGFFVPSFEKHAPIVSVSPSQVGFESGAMAISVCDGDGRELAKSSVPLKNGYGFVDLKEVFAGAGITGPVSVVCEFDRDIGEFADSPVLYVHLYYRSAGEIADQVHSHFSVGYATAPNAHAKSYRCLKFAPFIKDENLEFFYSIHNIGGSGSNVDTEIFVRVMTDTGFEKRFRWPAPADRITFVSQRELLKGIESEIERCAIVQYEHATTNFNGSWHFVNHRTGCMGTDHFTGG